MNEADELRLSAGPGGQRRPAEVSAAAGTSASVMSTDHHLSITDFLTDGSLTALCAAITAVTGTPVVLRDPDGRLIVTASGADGGRRWAVRDAEGPVALAEAPEFVAPLTLSAGVIGTLEVPSGDFGDAPETRATVGRFLELLASIVAELCEQEISARQRVQELEALRRMSSLLVGATDTDALLHVAVRSAVELLGADAGTVRAFEDQDRRLTLRAWVGLSPEYVKASVAVPADSIPDRAALTGEVFVSEDLWSETSAPNLEARKREGLKGMISAGLVFRGKCLGVMRLFTREPRRYTASERGLFKAIAEQSAAAMASTRLLQTEKEHMQVRRQVRLAADVQRRLLPKKAPEIQGLDVAARAIPSFELSGDFYDFIDLNGHLGIAVGDVVGKGVAAALLMAATRSFIRAYAQDVYDIDEIMNRVNQALCRDTRDNEFATIFYGVVDPRRKQLTYCNGGHEPPIVVHTAAGRAPTLSDVQELSTGGMVVGVDPLQRYHRGIVDLRPGDVVLAYTDGLCDTTNFDGEKFGKRRVRQALLDVLTSTPSASADTIADHLIWENRRFVGLNTRSDDTTLVVMRVG